MEENLNTNITVAQSKEDANNYDNNIDEWGDKAPFKDSEDDDDKELVVTIYHDATTE